ncbi:MAG TPA: peptidoglycan-binding domain-containing protein, partial [Vineibacter sp.]|nr:peptidoglycan-binding domain-containing protein [Vineibacter sp.]
IEVAQLQGRLRALGFNPGPADGVVGPRTVTAVREFQAAHGLTVTGTIDSGVFDDVSVAQAKTMKPTGTP